MKSVKFRVAAEPIAQGRPRFTTINGQARAFDPKKSRDWKSFVKDIAQRAMFENGHTEPFDGPIVARMRFAFSLPKSHHRKRTPRLDNGTPSVLTLTISARNLRRLRICCVHE